MANCTDCIHYDSHCCEPPYGADCDGFKDKSLYIKLPCKVGDTVYFDAVGYHDTAEIDGIHIDNQGILYTWVQYDVGVDLIELWDEGDFNIEDIGKTVFLTREEAEKALKER